MKNFTSEKLVYLGSTKENNDNNEKYRYGATVINVSEFPSLVDSGNCVVITFDRGRRSEDWKKKVAGYFGMDLSSCSFDNYAIYGKAI